MPSAWDARLSDLVRGIAGLRESTALELLPDLMPVMDVLTEDPEWAFLRGDRYVVGFFDSPAVAGRNSFITLNIPNFTPPSGQLAIAHILDVQILATTAGPHQLYGYQGGGGLTLSDTTNHVPMDARDQRWIQAGLVPCKTMVKGTVGDVAALPLATAGRCWAVTMSTANTFSQRIPVDAIITPGQGFGWCCSSQNVGLVAMIRWEEHACSSPTETQLR